jgi:hypothetical protein
MLIPGQDQTLLGIELVILGLVALAVGTSLQYRTLGRLHKSLRKRWIARIALLYSGAVFGVIGGFSLLVGMEAGFTGLSHNIIYLAWSILNSWQLIVWLPEEEEKRRESTTKSSNAK